MWPKYSLLHQMVGTENYVRRVINLAPRICQIKFDFWREIKLDMKSKSGLETEAKQFTIFSQRRRIEGFFVLSWSTFEKISDKLKEIFLHFFLKFTYILMTETSVRSQQFCNVES
jgi:hypothetical protein